ncbi:ABC transporter ATP-binding protein/permease [bacterium]|nr:ABC transporter ATP-binding protein/permease [bacterium]
MGVSHVFLFGWPMISRTAIDGIVDGAYSPTSRLGSLLTGLAGSADPRAVLAVAALLVVGCTLGAGAFLYLRGRWAASASEAIVRDLRNRIFAHLEALPCATLDRADTGDLVQRATSDVETVRVFLSGQVVEIGRAVLLFLTALPILIALDARMAAIAIALYPVIIGFAIVFFRRIQNLFLATDEAEGAMTAVLQENLTGIRVVRAFARQDFECGKFGAANAEFRNRNYELIRVLGTYWSISDFVCFSQVGLTLGFGAWWLLQGSLSVGTLFAILTYQSMVIWPVRQLGRVLTDAGKALVALGRIGEILEEPEETAGDAAELAAVEGDARPERRWRARGDLVVRNLSYAFGDEPVLRDVSFTLEAGETLALVGPPGSGKSTLIHLLLRLYDYDEGEILLDGQELRTLPRKLVRSQVGAVLQEPFLYSKTIGANVRLARTEAPLEDVVNATTAADIHGSISEFEAGYDTLVGERGVTLSGGQRQRLSIARALLKDPPILVLDDALSAVDTRTETRILRALNERRGKHTTIVIAHRLSSVAAADRILVFEDGAVEQDGTHEELMTRQGAYRRLWELQGSLADGDEDADALASFARDGETAGSRNGLRTEEDAT